MKILYYGDCSTGSLGIIHRNIKKYLEVGYPDIQFHLMDWNSSKNKELLFDNAHWTQYDLILSMPNIVNICKNANMLLKKKIIAVYHSDLDIPSKHFNHGLYNDWFTTVCGISNRIVDHITTTYRESQLLPVGVDTAVFFPFKTVTHIAKIGFVGKDQPDSDYDSIKRVQMFKDICNKVNIAYEIITGRPHDKVNLYNDIDLVICTSTHEGNLMAFLETVACKIPFISTRVGIVREYPSVQTFETVDEAVHIIQHLNHSKDRIHDYVETLYQEIVPGRKWDAVLDNYWVPFFRRQHDALKKSRYRIHVLGVPHTITNKEFVACAYTQKVWKFCKMMKGRGHTLYHYGHEDSDTLADEDVTVMTNTVWKDVYGTHDHRNNMFKYNTNDAVYKTFYENTIREIQKRKQPRDIILPFWGAGVRPICDAHKDLIVIEPGIGYADGHWANYKVFESYAMYHAYCGLDSVRNCQQNNYDIVIPNYFDTDEFEYRDDKEEYFLFVGRVYSGKGIHIVLQVAEATGIMLKIAGQVDEHYRDYKWPSFVEFLGYVNVEQRRKLMKNAKGSFVTSQYVEPFGGVQVENLLAGTPTITSDWGAFSENNIDGVTGYRCRTFEDYVKAVRMVQQGHIDSNICRQHGERFSLQNIAPMYESNHVLGRCPTFIMVMDGIKFGTLHCIPVK